MLVPDLLGFEFFCRCSRRLLQDVFEADILLLQNSVFGAQIQRIVELDGILERGMNEFIDRLVGVVHAQHDAGALKLVDLHLGGGRAVRGGESHVKSAGNFWTKIA